MSSNSRGSRSSQEADDRPTGRITEEMTYSSLPPLRGIRRRRRRSTRSLASSPSQSPSTTDDDHPGLRPNRSRTSRSLFQDHRLPPPDSPIKLNNAHHHLLDPLQPTPPNHFLPRFPSSFDLILWPFKLILWTFKLILSIILPHSFAVLLPPSLLLIFLYLLAISFTRLNLIDSIRSLSAWIPSSLPLPSPIVYLYCSLPRAPFCNDRPSKTPSNSNRLAQIARTVTGTARRASDIFESVLRLSDPNDLGLHQAEILELGYAVRWSTDLLDRELLSDGLAELGDLTRELKDRLIDLNGQGLNTFSFIAYEFSRLGDLIDWVRSGKKHYTPETISRNLDILFNHLSAELKRLLNTIESLIPLAFRSTNLGIQISERLHREHYQLASKRSNQALWKKLLDITSFSGQQLQHDLHLTSQSIVNLRLTWLKLEEVRTDLLSYRNNVANFKASFTGWHLADHQLSPEDELFSMRAVIQTFQSTLRDVKSRSTRSALGSSTEPPVVHPDP